ncbi:MAG TPA: DUF86 domain-containing protein [Chitinispirillaceae bacterium]|nr:DUF86 domain-containing protein [Chitinispirillaceae bacterium]
MADPLIIKKIDSLSRCIARIEEKRPETIEDLERNVDIQDIIAINLERAVQQCVDSAMIVLSNAGARVPETMSDAFDQLYTQGVISKEICSRMQNAVGFRNLIVHAYRKIDWKIVWNIITEHLDDFKVFAAEIMRVS